MVYDTHYTYNNTYTIDTHYSLLTYIICIITIVLCTLYFVPFVQRFIVLKYNVVLKSTKYKVQTVLLVLPSLIVVLSNLWSLETLKTAYKIAYRNFSRKNLSATIEI